MFYLWIISTSHNNVQIIHVFTLIADRCALAVALAACGGGGGGTPATTPPASTPPSITLSSTSSQTLSGGKPVPLSATVSSSDAVTWQLATGAPGSLSAASGGTVNYVPPASVGAITRVDIVASAGGASKTISLTLYPDPGAPGLSHIAGSLGGPGYLDGAGTAAHFSNIVASATDSIGNLYAAENGIQNAIRKITADGVVTTLLATTYGHADGPASQAQLGTVRAIAAGSNGAILFIDSDINNTYLRQLAPDGSVTTLSQHPLLEGARALVIGPGNTAYIMRSRSIVVAGAGSVTVLAGNESDTTSPATDGPGPVARFVGLSAMTMDGNGDLLVIQSDRLTKVTLAGTVITGRSTSTGTANNDEVTTSLALASNGMPMVLVLNSKAKSYAVRLLAPTAVANVFIGSYLNVPFDMGQTIPLQLHIAGGKVLLTRSTDIRQFQDNTWQPFAGLSHDSFADMDGPGTSARFANPELLTADSAGNLYVSDYPGSYATTTFSGRSGGLYLRKVAPDNTVSTLLNHSAFGVPSSIVADKSGNVYVSELLPLHGRIRPSGGAVYKVTPAGTLSLLAGQSATTGSSDQQIDGIGSAARFIRPELAGLDSAGNVYVSDLLGFTKNVRKIAPDGTVTTVAALPAGVDATPDGYTYTEENGAIYRATASGKEVVAGVPGRYGTVLGTLPGGLAPNVVVTPTGPYSLAVISGSAILKLVLPH